MSFEQEVNRRRTFAIISHPDAGKTTLTEKILYHGGQIHEAGEVKGKAGTKAAKSDWMEMERQRGISITSSVMQFDYKGLKVNLLDTPGHKDFSEDTYRTLTAVDSAVMLIDVAKGVEERTKKLYEVCRYRHIPIFTFVNKLDREGKDPMDLIDEIESTLKMSCYPVNWPLGIGDRFRGVYDRFMRRLIMYDQRREGDEVNIVPAESLADPVVKNYMQGELFETFAEELQVVEGVLPPFEHQAFLDGKISPVMFGSAKQNFGVDWFLDFFCQFAPPPASRNLRMGGEISPFASDFSAFCFKMQANMDKKHRDRVAFLRVCSGKFERGMKVQHQRLDRELRLNFSNQFFADERTTLDEAYAGDIIGINDSGNFQIGDTISAQKGVRFEDIPKFAPERFAKIVVTDAMKRQKAQKGVSELAQEGAVQLFIDPFVGPQDPIIGVVGELQFEVLLHRLQNEYGLDLRLDRLSFTVARWPRTAEGDPVDQLKGNFTIYHDLSGNPVILMNQEWDLNWAKKENPTVEFCTSITPKR